MDRYLQTLLKWVSASSRSGANPWRIVNQIRSKHRIAAAAGLYTARARKG
ncbi:uncharacterized protein LACBIDRAFT_309919 [Laccaria bicolor S238N-H82]|uniref:Predicted protein n=1 Tax=Laccaria bicolor (strain S238N-H82 / ATCC MYA-4686) TaxID=486041 RepID=B0DTC5_LACBS|nr:uncharacterized protein LACBIDRAFT_309919 [Laccaria bicolor S238N-H82]EDR02251.1 predicted protein [Laccaria bicolor S238N-H82]|eukprot:XP_001887196.1 predicted protein [Laccaria bicolor S238N-H82]